MSHYVNKGIEEECGGEGGGGGVAEAERNNDRHTDNKQTDI